MPQAPSYNRWLNTRWLARSIGLECDMSYFETAPVRNSQIRTTMSSESVIVFIYAFRKMSESPMSKPMS
jgi:hypothetical protein